MVVTDFGDDRGGHRVLRAVKFWRQSDVRHRATNHLAASTISRIGEYEFRVEAPMECRSKLGVPVIARRSNSCAGRPARISAVSLPRKFRFGAHPISANQNSAASISGADLQGEKAIHMTRHKIAILVGSLRSESLNRKIALSVTEFAKDTLDCQLVEIGDLPLYNEDIDINPPAQYERFRAQVRAADGVLFCTPEYNRGLPAALKNALDVGSRPYGQSVWDKKPAAIISGSPGPIGAFGANHQLRQSCVFLNMPMMQQPEAYLGGLSADKFDEADRLLKGPLRDFVVDLATAFAGWVDLVQHGRRKIAEDAAHARRR